MNNKITKKDLKYFRYARKVAEKGTYDKVKMGCVAVMNNSVISTGYNGNKTHPLQMTYNKYRNFTEENLEPKIHAEIDCLSHMRDEDITWNEVKLYIYRICKSREHGIARPCLACMKFIKDLGIRHIYYTTDQGYAYEMIDKR